MKKTALFILILLCILSCSGCKVATMKEKHVIEGTIATVADGNFIFAEMNTGKTEEIPIEEYGKPIGEANIVSDGQSIYNFDGEKWEKLPIEGYEVWFKPVKIGETVFFVAEDPFNTEGSDSYIWKYENGKVEKLFEDKIWFYSGILAFDDNLIYCRWHRDALVSLPIEIICYNVSSGKKEHIADGDSLCWKEEGKSLFYGYYGGPGLVLYDFESGTKTMVNEELYFGGPPVYNKENGVMLVQCKDPRGYAYSIIYIEGILYPENNDFVYWDSYVKFMEKYSDVSDISSEISFFETYWN